MISLITLLSKVCETVDCRLLTVDYSAETIRFFSIKIIKNQVGNPHHEYDNKADNLCPVR